MQFKRWKINPCLKDVATMLSDECDIDAFVALIAAGRGYTDPMELDEFLSDELILSDVYELSDIEKAANIINESIFSEEKIVVFGDYDADGVAATALMYSYLKNRGARVSYYIPDRENDGYGMNTLAVERLKNEGTNLIITVDNGIAAIEEIKLAKSLGMKVVVTDHHLPQDELPQADAVVDPHRKDDLSSFKDICGVFVAYKVICAVEGKSAEEMFEDYGDLVALGTVADVMPLVSENRMVVREGVNLISSSKRIGITALLRAAGIEESQLTAVRLAFGVAPRINAAGRMGDASRAAQLLLTENFEEAEGLAAVLNNENMRRQSLEKKIFEQAVQIVEKQGYKNNRVIVVSGENWHSGVVGIVAARLCEKYGRPAIVLNVQDGVANGSARSICGFSIYDALKDCSYLLSKFGGHEMAAGLTLHESTIEAFRRRINEYASGFEKILPELKIDCKLNPAALSVDLAEVIKELAPFGTENPVPLFGIFDLTLERITPVGSGKHLRLGFKKGETTFSAMCFGTTKEQFPYDIGDRVDIAVNIDTNLYNDNISLSVLIKDIRISGINEAELIQDIDLYESFKSGVSGEYSKIVPERMEVGDIYRTILKNRVSLDRLIVENLKNIGYAKTLISAQALCELGICALDDIEGTRFIRIDNSTIKANLSDSKIIKELRGEYCGA